MAQQMPTPPPNPAKMPAPIAQRSPQPTSDNLHPAAREAAAAWSDINHELDRLRAENQRLANGWEVERKHCQELQYQLDQTIQNRDYYRAYAIEINTHLSHIEAAARAARDRSVEVAKQLPEANEEPAIDVDHIEQKLAEITKEMNGPMPSVVTQGPRN